MPFGYVYLMEHKAFSWLIISGFLLLLLAMCYTLSGAKSPVEGAEKLYHVWAKARTPARASEGFSEYLRDRRP